MIPEYTEYLIEFDTPHLVVYVSGLTPEGYWEEIRVEDEVDNPEDFALGMVEGFKSLGHFAQAQPVSLDA
jgi:hypothetical protein